MKTNVEIIESIKDRMKFEIEFTPNVFDTEAWKTYCAIVKDILEHEDLMAFFNELKQFAIEKGAMSNH